MSIYEIPLIVRYIDLSTGLATQKSKFTVLNGKGVFISYDIVDTVDLEEIKDIEPSIRETFTLIPADGYAEAIIRLFIECKGLSVGGPDIFSKAVSIDKKKAIIEFPSCFMMHKSKRGIPVCGELVHNAGEFGPCYVDDYIPQPFCPLVLSKCKVISNYGEYLDSASVVTYEKIKYKLIKVKQEIESPKLDFKYIEVEI